MTPTANSAATEALGGAAFYSCIGTAWAAYGVYSLHGRGQPWPAALVILAAFALLTALLRVRQTLAPPVSAGAADELVSDAERKQKEREGRVFLWVNIGQGLAIFLMVQVCVNLHCPQYITPLFALIVGLHFFFLAPAFKARYLWLIGSLLCLLAAGTVFAVPLPLWRAFLGLGSGVIFWGGAVYRLRIARLAAQMRSQVRN